MKTKLIKLVIAAFIAIAGVGVLAPHPVTADGPSCSILPATFCEKSTGTPSGEANSKNSGVFMVLQWVLAIMTAGVGIVAVAALVYAGILYSSSDGKAEQVKKAKDMIVQTVIGLFAFAIMATILIWLIPGGIF